MNNGTISKHEFAGAVISVAFYISLWRGTGQWFGLASTFGEGVSADPFALQMLLYSLIPLTAFYILLLPMRFTSVIGRTPVLVIMLLVCCAASIPNSLMLNASVRGAAAAALLALVPLFYRSHFGSLQTFRALGRFIAVTACFNLLYVVAFPQFAIMGGSYAGMVKGAFYHKNILGQFCALAIFCSIAPPRGPGGLRYSDLVRWATVAALVILALLSRSSTAIVMIVTGFALLMGLRGIQAFQTSSYRLFVVIISMSLLTILIASMAVGALELIAQSFGKDLTFTGRTDIWEQLIPYVWDRPFFGHGFAVFRQPEIMERYVSLSFDAFSTHNTYLELALNIGIIGTIVWLAFLITRIVSKIIEPSPEIISNVRRTEVVLILMIMFGAFTEAGAMLAPIIWWPLLVLSLSKLPEPVAQRHTRLPSGPIRGNGI